MRVLQSSFFFLALAAPAAAQDVVVTAQRRAQPAASVPSAIGALSQEDIARISAQAPSEALNRLPGVAIHRGSGVESLPAIRSPVLTGGQGAGSFLVLEDGVPIRAPGLANINQAFELSLPFAQGLEVTRGPGGATYGANAVHGVVNVLTRGGAPGVHAQVEAGDFGRTRVQALAIGARALAGIAALREEGWRADAGVDLVQALAGYDGAFGGVEASARIAFANLEQETAGFVEGREAWRDETLSRANANPEAYRDSRVLRAHARFDADLGGAWTLALTPYARLIDTDLLLHFFPSKALEETSQTGGGLQSALYWDPAADLSLIVGADLDHARGRLRETQGLPSFGTFPQGVHYDYVVDATVLAAFAQARWTVAPSLEATLGLRGEVARYDYDTKAMPGDSGRFRRPADREDVFETLTPKLALLRRMGPGASAWVSLARGARAPQAADLYSLQTLQQPGDQKAETIDSAELGYRARFSWGRVEVVGFAMDKRNSAFRNADGFTVPNGRTRHVGLEVAGEVAIGSDVTLSGWASHARHTYRFTDPSARAGEAIRSGDDVDSAPRRLANLQLRWTPVASFDAELGWTHMGRYFTNAANSRDYPGHDVLDLRARWRPRAEFSVDVAARNLADVRYAERADFAFGQDRFFPGEARALTLGLTARR